MKTINVPALSALPKRSTILRHVLRAEKRGPASYFHKKLSLKRGYVLPSRTHPRLHSRLSGAVFPPFSQAPPNKRIEYPNDDQEALRVAKVYQQHLMSLRLLCLPVTPSTSHHVLLPLPANELTLIATMSPSHSSPSQLVSLSSAQIQHCAIIRNPLTALS
jgi:hypothetical protein